MAKKVVLTLEDEFYQEFKETYGRPGKPMTQIILDKMYEILKMDEKIQSCSSKFYNHINECLKEADEGKITNLGQCKTGEEVFKKLGIKA